MDVNDKASKHEATQLSGVGGEAGTMEAQLVKAIEAVGHAVKGLRANQKGMERELGKLVSRMARLSSTLDPGTDPRFVDLAQPLVDQRHTMLGYDRLHTLWQAVRNAAPLPYPAAEVGTFRGGSAALIAGAFRTLAGSDRELHVVDTFEGHLDGTFSEFDTERQRGKFQSTTVEAVRALLAGYAGVHIHQGDAASVISAWPERQYSLVHLDVDLYQPMIECLVYFGARVPPGGIIVVDDYESPTCPGVAQAVGEYLGRERVFQQWRMQAEQAVLIRR